MVISVRDQPPGGTTNAGSDEAAVRHRWGDTLRLERHRRRLTQGDVARLADVSQKVVWAVENGQGSLQSFLTVARTLDVDLFAEVAAS